LTFILSYSSVSFFKTAVNVNVFNLNLPKC
jgi:hypothetical protein